MKHAEPMIIDKIRRITRDGRWIPEIDGLRFIAISSVFLFHLSGELAHRSGHEILVEPRYHALFRAINNGDRGVLLFFVISGMILALPFARHHLLQAKEVSLRKYYMRRVTRLEPPYMLSMALFVILILVYQHGRLDPDYADHAAASFFYLHNLIYGSMSLINPVTWSLEVEIQFYLLAPLFMLIFRFRHKLARRIGLAIAILVIGLAQAPLSDVPRVALSILFSVQYFLAGLLLADIFVLDLPSMRTTWLWDVAGFAALIYMYGTGHDVYAAHVLLPFAFFLLGLAAMRGVLLRKFVSNPWVAVIGGMCYSIYLLHFTLMAAFFKATRNLIIVRFDFLANYAIQLAVMGIPVLLLSVLYYKFIERPCMDPDWPSKLWQRLTGRSGSEVELLDASGISES